MTTPGINTNAPAAHRGRRFFRAFCASAILGAALSAGAAAPSPRVRFLEARVESDPLDFVASNGLAGEYLLLLRQTGDLSYLDRAGSLARSSLKAVPAAQNAGGLAMLAVTELESHHFDDARALAERAYAIDPRNEGALATEGDAALELGRYDEAERIYRKLADTSVAPPVLARLARIAELRGDIPEAMKLLRHDPEEMLRSGVSPRNVAWYRVRLGELYFRTGDFEGADAEYRAACALDPDGYLAQEHLAELRGAQGRYDEAVGLYREVTGRVPRAELFQAFGDLYQFMGRTEEAALWHRKALDAYTRSIAGGHTYYVHHLAGYYADSQEDPAQALRWARRDLEARRSMFAYDALGWALYKNGRFDEADAAMSKALALGTKDSHLLYHAGLIASRAGDLARGRKLLQEALTVNPRANAFHVHR